MRLVLPILCSMILFLTSCGDVTQEIWIEKDTSTTTHYSYDMTDAISMLQMFGSEMSEDSASGGKIKMGNSTDDLENLIFGLEENTDTVFNLYDIAPAEEVAQGKLDDLPDFLQESNIKISNKDGSYIATLMIEFDQFEDIGNELSELKGLSKGDNDEFTQIIDYLGGIKLTNKSFYAPPLSLAKENESDDDEMGDQMLKQLFSTGNFISIYHMPSKVKSCSVADAEIKGKTVTITQPLKNIMSQTNDPGIEIKMKKYRMKSTERS